MLWEMVEYGPKIEEKMKAMKSEIKENAQGINSEGKIWTQINGLQQKEEVNIQQDQNEKTGIQKIIIIRKGLGTSGTILNIPTSES